MAEINLGGSDGNDPILVTSLKIYAKDAAGTEQEIGSAINLNPTERRPITYNFVIGNSPPDVARDLIPGTINESSFTVDYVALYRAGVLKAFGGAGEGFLVSLRNQNKPFYVKEVWTNPSDNKTKTITYGGCFIASYSSTRDISRGDIRIMENATINYRTIEVLDGYES